MLMLPAARLLHVPRPMAVVRAWLDGGRDDGFRSRHALGTADLAGMSARSHLPRARDWFDDRAGPFPEDDVDTTYFSGSDHAAALASQKSRCHVVKKIATTSPDTGSGTSTTTPATGLLEFPEVKVTERGVPPFLRAAVIWARLM